MNLTGFVASDSLSKTVQSSWLGPPEAAPHDGCERGKCSHSHPQGGEGANQLDAGVSQTHLGPSYFEVLCAAPSVASISGARSSCHLPGLFLTEPAGGRHEGGRRPGATSL